MDVFIPEDYVIRRRIEKKLAAQAPDKTRQPRPVDQRPRRNSDKDKEKETPGKTGFRFTATGADNVVFNCFSA
uniref:Uncharacterized protein n=1 Tax=Cucumis melo TaxID=3656 RepID=A0A9I9CM24_CUCME